MGWHQSNLGLAAGLHRWGKWKGGRDTPKPAASRAVRHLAVGAASHSQRRPGPARVCRPFAARCRCAKAKPKSTGSAGARANGRAGHWPPTGSGLADLERPPRTHSSQALLTVLHFFSLSSLSSVCLPFESILPTTHYPLPTPGARDPSTTSQRLDSTSPLSNGRTHQSNLDSPTRPPIPIAPRRPRNHRLWIDAPHSAPWR